MSFEGYRLGTLQMGVARHYRVGVFVSLCGEGGYKLLDERKGLVAFVAQIKAHIEGDLVVTAPARMQALARVADALGQGLLDKGVDILGVRVDGKCAVRYLGFYLCKLGGYGGAVLGGDYPLGGEHGHMGDAALDILSVHPGIRRNG